MDFWLEIGPVLPHQRIGDRHVFEERSPRCLVQHDTTGELAPIFRFQMAFNDVIVVSKPMKVL